jgi:hypothetical protein
MITLTPSFGTGLPLESAVCMVRVPTPLPQFGLVDHDAVMVTLGPPPPPPPPQFNLQGVDDGSGVALGSGVTVGKVVPDG